MRLSDTIAHWFTQGFLDEVSALWGNLAQGTFCPTSSPNTHTNCVPQQGWLPAHTHTIYTHCVHSRAEVPQPSR